MFSAMNAKNTEDSVTPSLLDRGISWTPKLIINLLYLYISFVKLNRNSEGSNFEAMLFAAHHDLDNLNLIIDYNNLQSLTTVGKTLNILPIKICFMQPLLSIIICLKSIWNFNR